MKKSLLIFTALCVSLIVLKAQQTSTKKTGETAIIQMINVQAGRFLMGSAGYRQDYDERPAHAVTISSSFNMAATEITNAQYEQFDPKHRKYRGLHGLSKNDDDAVIMVDYSEAAAFCKWLSEKEGKNYRLPTEAEWEYACRAGTFTAYFTGDGLPAAHQNSQETMWNPKPVSLQVRTHGANQWGLFDMHGNVEEWCLDWYGPYTPESKIDPVGRASGLYRITRGGSFGTPVRFLRSANRSAMIPTDKNWLVGFRIVEGKPPSGKALPAIPSPAEKSITQKEFLWAVPTDLKIEKPVYLETISFVLKPANEDSPTMYAHNHCPAITWCPNGDLLAVWFSTDDEAGREMTILSSRLRKEKSSWEQPSLFFKVPDRNMTGSSLFVHRATNTLYFMNGVETAGSWQNLAMVLRTSKDNGASWTDPQMANPDHAMRNQVIAGMFSTSEGVLVQAADATPAGQGGTSIHVSRDLGKTWERPYKDSVTPSFTSGKSGGLIAGIHAGVVQLGNGDLMALGRGNNIEVNAADGPRMPMSISKDMGSTWQYAASPFPPIAGGQRLVLKRLNEGALLLVSFTNHPSDKRQGMTFKDKKGSSFTGYGMYAAVSYDDGKTWPVLKLVTEGPAKYMYGGAWTGYFEMNKTHAEPRGYLAITQSPDNMIHLLSSSNHYRMNLKWLETPNDNSQIDK
ncbi:MAG: SUMF1/EgtB/PvdO family nonheme iron enzyme [Chitinophagaceae bacterium]